MRFHVVIRPSATGEPIFRIGGDFDISAMSPRVVMSCNIQPGTPFGTVLITDSRCGATSPVKPVVWIEYRVGGVFAGLWVFAQPRCKMFQPPVIR